MERVEGIEPSHQPWQGRRLPLHHTRFKMVDRKRIELFPKACKAPVLPLSLTAHLKILHQYIVFVKLKIKLYDYDLRIYEDFTTLFQMSITFNFSLLYLLMVVYYNSNILIVKSKKWSE